MFANKQGFTLLETMVAIALFAIIMSATYVVLLSGNNAWADGELYVHLNQEMRKVQQSIAKDLRQSSISTFVITGANQIDFDIPVSVADGGSVIWESIRYSLSGPTNNQLNRTNITDGTAKIITNNIQQIAFTQIAGDPARVDVDLTVERTNIRQRNMQLPFNFDVLIRN